MKRRIGIAVMTVEGALVALVACSSSTSPSGATTTASKSIGTSGGTVTDSNGDSVQIPAGALASNVTITITSAPSAPSPAGATRVGTPVTFQPEGQQFLVPVTVTLPFSASLLPSPSSTVVLYTAPAGSSSYAALAGSSVSGTQVSAPTSHFSTFVPAVASSSMSGSDASAGGPDGSVIASDASTTGPDSSVSCTVGPVTCMTEVEGAPCCPVTNVPCVSAGPNECDFECICTANGTHCGPCGSFDGGSAPEDAGCSAPAVTCMTEPPEGTACCPVTDTPCYSASPSTCDFGCICTANGTHCGPCDSFDGGTAPADSGTACSAPAVSCMTEPAEGTPCCPVTDTPCESAGTNGCDYECICTANGTHCGPCGSLDGG